VNGRDDIGSSAASTNNRVRGESSEDGNTEASYRSSAGAKGPVHRVTTEHETDTRATGNAKTTVSGSELTGGEEPSETASSSADRGMNHLHVCGRVSFTPLMGSILYGQGKSCYSCARPGAERCCLLPQHLATDRMQPFTRVADATLCANDVLCAEVVGQNGRVTYSTATTETKSENAAGGQAGASWTPESEDSQPESTTTTKSTTTTTRNADIEYSASVSRHETSAETSGGAKASVENNAKADTGAFRDLPRLLVSLMQPVAAVASIADAPCSYTFNSYDTNKLYRCTFPACVQCRHLHACMLRVRAHQCSVHVSVLAELSDLDDDEEYYEDISADATTTVDAESQGPDGSTSVKVTKNSASANQEGGATSAQAGNGEDNVVSTDNDASVTYSAKTGAKVGAILCLAIVCATLAHCMRMMHCMAASVVHR
jgi:hypothetical protein